MRRQPRHQQEQRQRLLSSLPPAPYRLFVRDLLARPLAPGPPQAPSASPSNNVEDAGTAPCRLFLEPSQRVVEHVRCLGVAVKHEEDGGCWVDDGTGVIRVALKEASNRPPLGRLCEVVGTLRRRRRQQPEAQQPLQEQERKGGGAEQQPASWERLIAAQQLFLPDDPNTEASATLAILVLYKDVYLAPPSPAMPPTAPTHPSQPQPQAAALPPPSQTPTLSELSPLDEAVLTSILKGKQRMDLEALTGVVPSLPELEASLGRLQMEGLVYASGGAYFPL